MSFKLLIYLCITFHFDFAFFLEDLYVLESKFKNLIPFSPDYMITILPLKWAGACEYVFELLKLDPDFNNDYKYVHYQLFSAITYTMDLNAKLVLLSSQEIILQFIMPCYALRSAVISNSMPIDSYMNNDLGIYIFQNNYMAVFQCYYIDSENNPITRYYKLLAIYKNVPFDALKKVPDWIFHHPLIKTEELSSTLNNNTTFESAIKNIYNNER